LKRIIAVLLLTALVLGGCQMAMAQEAAPAATPTPALTGPKLRIAVLDIQAKAGGSYKVGDTIQEMIITALVNSGKYQVVERGELDSVLQEQDLGANGRVTPESAAKVGKMLGAQILIAGAITEYTDISSGGGVLLGPIVVGSKNAKLAIDLRVIDANTGQVLAAEKAEGTSTTAIIGGGGTVGTVPVGGVFGNNEPMGHAARVAVGKALDIILANTSAIKWTGRIIKRNDKEVYLNSGSNNGMTVGASFTVFSKGEDLIDPDTGLSLGSQEQQTGKITVTEIKDKYSIAKIISEDPKLTIKAGDIVRP